MTTLTKLFPFSASYSKGEKVIGRNYVLAVTVEAPSEEEEARLTAAIERDLVKKLESKDLGLHVDFLKDVPKDDRSLLSAFRPVVERAVSPVKLRSLSLERDARARTTLEA